MTTTNDPRKGMTSASNAQADLLCPGRHQAQVGLPDVPTDDADSGRRIHAALADGTDANMKLLSLEEREVFDACREIEKKVVGQFFGELPAGTNGNRVFRHERYWVRVPYKRADAAGPTYYPHSGEVDVVHRRGPLALIGDYKTLAGEVAGSPSNLQLRDLSVLVRGNLLVEKIGVVIIQPFVTHSPEVCLYDKAALDRAEQEMFNRVITSHSADALRVPGDLQCKFCKAKSQCQEHQRWATSLLPQIGNLIDKFVADWTEQDYALFLEREGVARQWLDGCWEAAKEFAKKRNIPGWKLKPGNERENIIHPQEVFNRFVALGGKPEAFVGKCVSVGKGKLREAVNEATGAKGKSLDAAMTTLLEGCTETKQNAPSLVKE